MHAEQIIATVRATGGQLALLDGKLKAKRINEYNRLLIRKHKLEIIKLLKVPAKPVVVNPHLNPCYSCDGLELINGDNGGFFCMVCQPYIRPGVPVVAGRKRLATDIKGDDPRWCALADGNEKSGRSAREKPTASFMIAHKWIIEHRQDLRSFGWTAAELYRGNKSRGIAWLKIWDQPNLQVSIPQNGSIVFQYINETGTSITQIAFPLRKEKNIRVHQYETEKAPQYGSFEKS